MSRLTRKQRQEILDDYCAQSGANQFDPALFVDWLSERPDHPAYGWFQWDDDKAANEYRVWQARTFASGLKIGGSFEIQSVGGGPVRVVSVDMPAMISPMEGRRAGGGYIPLRTDDPIAMESYCEEAARSLDAWCRRYEGAVTYRGGKLNAARKLIALLAPAKSEAA